MTIHELLALTGLTANDEIPVWDEEASGEPTKKITAQNFAAAVKTLASLLGTGDVVNDLTINDATKVASQAEVYTLNSNLRKIQRGQVTGITLVQGQTEVTVTLPEAYSSGNTYVAVASVLFYGGANFLSAVLIRQQYAASFVCRIYNSLTQDIVGATLNWITMPI